VHARNILLVTIFITGIFTYLLLGIAIVNKASVSSVVAAAAFYVVGEVAGLFSWLYRGSQIDTIIDDYGLSMARLIATPLLSGLAGVIGVLITVMLYSSLLGIPQTPASGSSISTPAAQASQTASTPQPVSTLTPSASQTTLKPAASATSSSILSTLNPTPTPVPNPQQTPLLCATLGPTAHCTTFSDVFYLDPRLLIAAILFGLAPSLVIGTLLQRAQQYVTDLNSVKPAVQGTY
jgi:hypothetical protein